MRSIVDEFLSIKRQLQDLGLFSEDALVLVAGGGVKVVFDAEGRTVRSDIFDKVEAKYAVFTSGPFSRAYAEAGKSLKASCDDMAQMFGPVVRCVAHPDRLGSAFIIKDRGFVATGRFESELIAAAILLEKMCRAELLAPKIGELAYLNPALCAVEHAVYLSTYSKHEKEAEDGDM